MHPDLESILYTREELTVAVKALGEKITQDYQGKDLVMVCILKGAAPFFTDLIRSIDLPMNIDFMVVSSYGASTKSTGEVQLVKDMSYSVSGKDVIIVEDIVDTGMTLSYLKKVFQDRNTNSVRIATLLDKPERRKVVLEPDYKCFTIPDAFVVGYGLDYAEQYRNLPDVGILAPRVYEK
ncbi:MAG: hypoxanthine phosphoribosyltransferase [Clostridiales bacterium]|nr:hypoxanthine phosphoribosyltransferase [Clostridiales bacterium]